MSSAVGASWTRPSGAGLAPEDVPLDPLQVEQIEQGIECVVRVGHLDYRPIDLAMIDFMISLVPP